MNLKVLNGIKLLMQKRALQGHIMAFLTVFIWGTTFVATKVLLPHFSALGILFFRFSLAFVLLFLIRPSTFCWQGRKRECMMLFAGFFGVFLYYLLESIALTYTYASNVSVIVSAAPIFTFLFIPLFGREKVSFSASFFIGFALALFGIFLISFAPGEHFSLMPKGDLLALLAAVAWGIYSNLSKIIADWEEDTVKTTRRIFLYGLLFLFPLTIFTGGFDMDWSLLRKLDILLNLLFLALAASGLCFLLWNKSVALIGSLKASLYIYLQPLITAFFSFFALGEPITPRLFSGMALVLMGLIISEKKGSHS